MKSFQQQVLELTKQIPIGKVTTYKEIGSKLHTRAFRAIGSALHNNPHLEKIPCHRVINSNGDIGGYAGDENRKKELLESEGIRVKNNKIDLDIFGFTFSQK